MRETCDEKRSSAQVVLETHLKEQFPVLGNILICLLAESYMRIQMPPSCVYTKHVAGVRRQ